MHSSVLVSITTSYKHNKKINYLSIFFIRIIISLIDQRYYRNPSNCTIFISWIRMYIPGLYWSYWSYAWGLIIHVFSKLNFPSCLSKEIFSWAIASLPPYLFWWKHICWPITKRRLLKSINVPHLEDWIPLILIHTSDFIISNFSYCLIIYRWIM